MALGAGAVTPWQTAECAMSVFANGGYRMQPYLVAEITDATGKVLMEAKPQQAGTEADRVLGARNAFIDGQPDARRCALTEPRRARRALKRAGHRRQDRHHQRFARRLVRRATAAGWSAVGWMGFDQPRPLGERETGGGLALPIWMGYMAKALKGVPESYARGHQGVSIIGGEYYFVEIQPGQGIASVSAWRTGCRPRNSQSPSTVRDQIF